MIGTCLQCGEPTRIGGVGRPQRFCSNRCRQAAHRARRSKLPSVLTGLDRWTRRAGKRPITVSGAPASSTNPSTWSSFEQVRRARVGDGLGFMLGDGIGCVDLDHCIDGAGSIAGWALDELARIDSPLWVERSMSGRGIHVFVRLEPGPGRCVRDGVRSVEVYSQGRFIAVTGDRLIL